MRALLAIPLLFVAEALAVDHQFVSPNGELEAYTTAANQDGTGMKLYLRRANSRHTGVLLRQNDRWIDAKWSPDSQFLAVVDHLDGNISDVYVFSVAAANAAPTLLYHTPDLHKYDVKWEVTDWDVARRQIILDKEVKHEIPGGITHEKIEAPVGKESLKYEPTE
jgi:hypothetical protein